MSPSCELAEGHINGIVKRAIGDGCDLFNVLRVGCLNPIDHYSLPVGRLRVGDPADLILVSDLVDFKVLQTYIDDRCIAKDGKVHFDCVNSRSINRFDCDEKIPTDFQIHPKTSVGRARVRVIKAIEGELITAEQRAECISDERGLRCDLANDVLKIAVVNRYQNKPIATAFIHGFGLRRGAIASSVGHDSHNILAVGVDDESLCAAVNQVIAYRGGTALNVTNTSNRAHTGNA